MASKPLHIRRAVREDLSAILEIERASFSDPWSLDALATALDRMLVLVAAEGADGQGDGAARLVGYVVALVVAPTRRSRTSR